MSYSLFDIKLSVRTLIKIVKKALDLILNLEVSEKNINFAILSADMRNCQGADWL